MCGNIQQISTHKHDKEYKINEYENFLHRKDYAVVEFLDTNEIEIIPSCWLLKDGKKCVWPNNWKPSRISNAVKLKDSPDDTFTAFKVKVLYDTGKLLYICSSFFLLYL